MRSSSLISQLTQRFSPTQAPLSRRAFLKASAAAGAALLLSQSKARARGTPPRVVIIGAGFAGLSCAYELAAAGVTPVVLEARGRVGGRVRTISHPTAGAHAEAGGEFVGEQHHVWGAYAKQFNLPLVSCFETPAAATSLVVDGQLIPTDAAYALYLEMSEAFVRISEDARQVDAAQPWRSAQAARWDHTSVAQKLDAMPLSALCRRLLEVHFSNENAVATARQSYLGLLALVKGGGNADYWTQTEALRCAVGNQRLAHALGLGLPSQALKLRHPVQRIDRLGAGLMVTCHNGSQYACDMCVLAVPPSAWRHMHFAPGLMAGLTEGVEQAMAPQMGPAIKHLAWFDRVQTPGDPAVFAADYDGTLWPMLRTGAGSAGEVFFSAAESAGRYRALAHEAREALRATLRCESTAKPLAQTLSMQFIDWPVQRFTQSGYSFPAPGEVTRCGPLWRDGIGPLQFIGEHTHHAFVGFMEGALRSGVGMAARIVRPTSSNPF